MKRLAITLAVLTVILVAIVASLPLFVSSTTVRSYILEELEDLTGREISFRGDPGVSFSPFLGIEISDLEIADPNATNGEPPLLNVSKVQAQLDIIPALFGSIKITQYRLVRPRLNLRVYSDGKSNWHFSQGRLNKALQQTRDSLQENSEDSPQSADLGAFLVVDGAIHYEDSIAGQMEDITSINGTIVWPSTSEPARISNTSIWHGEIVDSTFEFSKPLELMAGGETEATIKFDSAPAAIDFSGSANRLSGLFVKGDFELNTPSLKRFSEFFTWDITDFIIPGSISMSGSVEATNETMRISDAEMNIAENTATGVLSLSQDEVGNASIDGTLAFDSVDLSDFIAERSESIEQLAVTGDTKGIKVDLRISANSIKTGFLELSQVAAAVNVTDKNWTFDVGDSQTLGGSLVARIGERADKDKPLILLEVSAKNIDTAALSELFPDRVVGFTGTGDFDASLRSRSFADLAMTKGIDGSLNVSLTNGTITGIDIQQLLAGYNDEDNPNPVETELGDTTEFENSRFNFIINKGIASISKSSIVNQDSKIQMIGRVDLKLGNLALRAQEITDEGPEPERLFIGGNLKAPLLSLRKSSLKQSENGDPQTSNSISN